MIWPAGASASIRSRKAMNSLPATTQIDLAESAPGAHFEGGEQAS